MSKPSIGVRAELSLIAFGALLGASVTILTPQAHAWVDVSPKAVVYGANHMRGMCGHIDLDPQPETIEDVILGIFNDGLDPKDTADALVMGVSAWCPQHLPLIDALSQKWSTARQAIGVEVGQR